VIEVNLLPGGTKRAGRKPAAARKALKLPAVPTVDRMVLGTVAAWIIGPALLAFLFLGTGNRLNELERLTQTAVQDSTRYARIIQSTEALQARRDTIAQKLQVIQDIDAGRYIWAHVVDEVARALPRYTWLTGISQVQPGASPRFRVEGATGTTMALTEFMTDLEASPFIRNVRLTSTQLDRAETVHAFILEMQYEEPPPHAIRTVPLFVPEVD
jgi:Tfp pilus assembly protein PilN